MRRPIPLDRRRICSVGYQLPRPERAFFEDIGMAKLESEIDTLFAQWDRKDSPGAAVAVVHKGKPIVRRGYGMASLEHGVPLSPESVIRIGSQTKQFTTFLAWSLIKEGKLGLDDDIRKYHPE